MRKSVRQQRHALQRLSQRYDKNGDPAFLHRLVNEIKNDKAEFVARSSARVTIWIVELDGIKYRVVYDRNRKMIATFLPMERDYIGNMLNLSSEAYPVGENFIDSPTDYTGE